MARYAFVKDGKIQNVTEAEVGFNFASVFGDTFDAYPRIDDQSPEPGIGWGYDGQDFSPGLSSMRPVSVRSIPLGDSVTGSFKIVSAVFIECRTFRFADGEPAPSTVKVLVSASKSDTTADVRIRNLTTGEIIAGAFAVDFLVVNVVRILNLGQFNPCPAGESVLSLEVRRASGTGTVSVYELSLEEPKK